MTIKDKTIIDAMGRDENTLYLFAYDDQTINNKEDLLVALQDKIDTYMFYIVDEQYKDSYDNIDKFIVIFEFKEEVNEDVLKFFKLINKKIDEELKRKEINKNVSVKYQYAKKE